MRKDQLILLEQQFVRHSAGNGPFYRPIGGSIELGETSGNALKRELQEESSADIDIARY
ncbi:NUDIX domain-containing protein [Planococcus versutus]|uniref:NUDIX domain-containing protein n=1 Tax=Planococcus versutus TaxID=1302659 RepID=UPI0012FF8594|nr:NUDIX domain-containing protein [Planococcus versutus]